MEYPQIPGPDWTWAGGGIPQVSQGPMLDMRMARDHGALILHDDGDQSGQCRPEVLTVLEVLGWGLNS